MSFLNDIRNNASLSMVTKKVIVEDPCFEETILGATATPLERIVTLTRNESSIP